jgi:hypothetical protein
MDRRFFLKQSGIGLASFGFMAAAPEFLHQFANAQVQSGYGRKKVLVTIFQRGAVDGLNMVVPHGDGEYYSLRRTIAVPKPGSNNGAIDLDGHFGLNPAMKPLETFWKNKNLAIVTAAGSPDNTRSHFDAQDYMESGTPGQQGNSRRLAQSHSSSNGRQGRFAIPCGFDDAVSSAFAIWPRSIHSDDEPGRFLDQGRYLLAKYEGRFRRPLRAKCKGHVGRDGQRDI